MSESLKDNILLWSGPRGAGKTEYVKEILQREKAMAVYQSADRLVPPDGSWLRSCIRQSIDLVSRTTADTPTVLVLDEIQRIAGWEKIVQEEYQLNRKVAQSLQVVLVSSTAFPREVLKLGIPQWFHPVDLVTFKLRYSMGLDEYLFFGGQPQALRLLLQDRDEAAWRKFLTETHLETVLGRDLPQHTVVNRPHLLRELLQLCFRHAGTILPIHRLAKKLSDKPHSRLVVAYLRLLEEAHLIRLAKKFTEDEDGKSTMPRLIVLDNSLITATSGLSYAKWMADPGLREVLVRNAVGARLVTLLHDSDFALSYWKDRKPEVDFVISGDDRHCAFVVKASPVPKGYHLKAFKGRFENAQGLCITNVLPQRGEMALEQFLTLSIDELLAAMPF